MKSRTEEHGDVVVISLQGNLMGGPDATSLNNQLHKLVEAGTRRVVIDLKEVEVINSSGLGMLIGGLNTMRSAGGDLRIANAARKITEVIRITKLSAMFKNYTSVGEAVESFRG
jgi:anti-sigma B factor antagonist